MCSQVHGRIVPHSMKLRVRVDFWHLRLFSHRFTNICTYRNGTEIVKKRSNWYVSISNKILCLCVFFPILPGLQCKYYHHRSCDSTAWSLSGRSCSMCQGSHRSRCQCELQLLNSIWVIIKKKRYVKIPSFYPSNISMFIFNH